MKRIYLKIFTVTNAIALLGVTAVIYDHFKESARIKASLDRLDIEEKQRGELLHRMQAMLDSLEENNARQPLIFEVEDVLHNATNVEITHF